MGGSDPWDARRERVLEHPFAMHPITPLLLITLLGAAPAPMAPPAVSDGPRKVAIVLFPGVELLDFAGPGEVFAAARGPRGRAFEVLTVAATREPLTSQRFLTISAAHTFADCPPVDLVVIPGGNVPDDDPALRAFVLAQAKDAEVVMSVCNGAAVLAAAGLLDGLEVTTHHSALEYVQMLAPGAAVAENRRFVDHGKVVTAAGVSAGIDGALQVVSRLCGEGEARAVARYMEYDWRPDELAKLHAQPARRVLDRPVFPVIGALADGGREAARAACLAARAAKGGPDEATLNQAAYTLMGTGRLQHAEALFGLITELHPGSANAWDSLSEFLERQGRGAEALAALAKALELLPRDPSLTEAERENLARVGAERRRRLAPPNG